MIAPMPVPGDAAAMTVPVRAGEAAFAALLDATVRAKHALADGLPNIAAGILETAVDDAWRSRGLVES